MITKANRQPEVNEFRNRPHFRALCEWMNDTDMPDDEILDLIDYASKSDFGRNGKTPAENVKDWATSTNRKMTETEREKDNADNAYILADPQHFRAYRAFFFGE